MVNETYWIRFLLSTAKKLFSHPCNVSFLALFAKSGSAILEPCLKHEINETTEYVTARTNPDLVKSCIFNISKLFKYMNLLTQIFSIGS